MFRKYTYKKIRKEIFIRGIRLASNVIVFFRKYPKFKKFLKKQDNNLAHYYKLMDFKKLNLIKKKLKDGNYINEKKIK